VLAFAWVLAGCVAHHAGGAHVSTPATPPRPAGPPLADSVTVGLWHFDERGGTRVADSSPFQVAGTAGPESRVEFGRFKGARGFVATAQSFVFVPYNPVMESPRGFSVEAWVYLNDISRYELSGIAMRWSPIPNEQSWLLGVVGRDLPPTGAPTSPGWFSQEVATLLTGHLVFAIRPDLAAGTESFMSSQSLPLNRWVHVAATVDGEVVRLFIDGRLDNQAAVPNGIRRSVAPLVVGNALDPRRLTDFGSDLHLDTSNLPLPFYALNGIVDELRISNAARTEFESAEGR
jgi:hypothetical protein